MFRNLARIQRFLASEDGPTAVEYAVMLALIVVVCIAVLQSLGTSVSGTSARSRARRRLVIAGVARAGANRGVATRSAS